MMGPRTILFLAVGIHGCLGAVPSGGKTHYGKSCIGNCEAGRTVQTAQVMFAVDKVKCGDGLSFVPNFGCRKFMTGCVKGTFFNGKRCVFRNKGQRPTRKPRITPNWLYMAHI